jgi:16S rRNA (cytosine1402-N4)-methyltransferase
MAGREGIHGTSALLPLFSEASGASTGGAGYHVPVLRDEVLEHLNAGPGRVIVDGTLGGGGHSETFLEAGATVIGIDRDPEALAHAGDRLGGFGERFRALQGNFGQADELLAAAGIGQVDGWLLDLGVSSRQLDAPERGFSFMREGPLDMRMGPSSPHRAADIVNTWDEDDLVRIFRDYGEEKAARKLARAIIQRRGDRPFQTTRDLASCIEAVSPQGGRIHPATRVFQAVRMAANDELGALERALELAPRLLRPGGRLLVISFHSLEDRLVKHWMQRTTAAWLDRPEWPAPRPNPDFGFRAITRKPVTAGAAEIARNPRSRSAKLRVVERLPNPLNA